MEYTLPPGVFDILPVEEREPWRASPLWAAVEKEARELAQDYGLREIRTPIFEKTELFKRSVGEGTDIVTKEMYTFVDRGDRSLTLRPEGTASVVRAFVENHLSQQGNLHKLFYLGPYFRYERSQAGRYRQFHQFGVEILGLASPYLDAEVIDLACTLYQRLGLKNLKVCINSIGDAECRKRYRDALVAYLEQHKDKLSKDSQQRLQTNPLRILDSKDSADQEIIQHAPLILKFLSEKSKKDFEKVQECLFAVGIGYTVTPTLVRGLDYYNDLVFEIVAGDLGAQNSIGGGGRYDTLVQQLGGPATPATGFATGIERIIQIMIAQKVALPLAPETLLYLIPLGDKAQSACFQLQHTLRGYDLAVEMDYSGRKIGKILQGIQKGVRYVAVVGDQELENGEIELKEMASGTVTKVKLDHLNRILQIENHADDFIKQMPLMQEPFQDPSETNFFYQRLVRHIEETQKSARDLAKGLDSMKSIFDT